MHIGNLRGALYNYLFAKKHGGAFILRVEDTDRERFVPGAIEGILRTLEIAGIVPDEGLTLKDGELAERGDHGPYLQSNRLGLYTKHAEELVAAGKAYRCFCTAEELEEMRKTQQAMKQPTRYDRRCRRLKPEEVAARLAAGEKSVVRLAVPETGETVFEDVIHGRIAIRNAELDDTVLLKSDGFPTYHLAVVVDDHFMEVTHVIRGDEWIPSAPKHVLLYQAFGWELPVFAHLPLLLNGDRSKLSKRQGDVAVEDYVKKGYLPEALVNFVALLGFNPSADREIYSLAELIDSFELAKVNSAGAVMNLEKLDWLNRHYLKVLPREEFTRRAAPFLEAAGLLKHEKEREWRGKDNRVYDFENLARVVELEKERISKFDELPEALSFAFETPQPPAAMLSWKGQAPADLKEKLLGGREFLAAAKFEDEAGLEAAARDWVKSRGWQNGETLWPLRVALSGREKSPGPFAIALALGKEESLKRIDNAIRTIE